MPSPVTMPDGDEAVDDTDAAALLCYLLNNACGDDWKDFEEGLGRINLLECFDDLCEIYDRDGDRNLWHEAYNNEDRTADLRLAIPKIFELFSDWIGDVEISHNSIKEFKKLIDPDHDLFITFNYTRTLEELYGCKNVIHMHGEVGKEIIIGHNGDIDYSEDNPDTPIGCFNHLQELYNVLRKDTDAVINKHAEELAVVADCSAIYSFGFSYSSVDKPYIERICSLIENKDVEWLFHSYSFEEETEHCKEVVKSCKFRGRFSRFST